jgi:hypothetical protein
MIHSHGERHNHSNAPSWSVQMLQVYVRQYLLMDPPLDYTHTVNLTLLPALELNRLWFLVLFEPSWNTFQNHISILAPRITTWCSHTNYKSPNYQDKHTIMFIMTHIFYIYNLLEFWQSLPYTGRSNLSIVFYYSSIHIFHS